MTLKETERVRRGISDQIDALERKAYSAGVDDGAKSLNEDAYKRGVKDMHDAFITIAEQ